MFRPRDFPLERELVSIAVQAGGHPSDFGLSEFADSRALPGGVRAAMDHRREALEEAADLRNYLVWKAEAIYDQAMRGEAAALDQYEWAMRSLSALVTLWRELLTEAS